MASRKLSGLRILVVEDEYFLADDTRFTLVDMGAEVIGPAPTAAAARALIETGGHIDGVLLDVNLRGEVTFDVADALQSRGIPFAFVTGYDKEALPERFLSTPRLGKPVHAEQFAQLLEELTAGRR